MDTPMTPAPIKTIYLLGLICVLGLASSVPAWHSLAQTSRQKLPDPVFARWRELRAGLLERNETNLVVELTRLLQDMLASQETSKAKTSLGVLQRLRDGRTTNLLELLESDLDTEIISVTSLTKDLTDEQIKLLRAAKAYRIQFPRKTEYPETDQDVARALSLADSK